MFKTGQIIEGTIVKKTAEFVTIDFQGNELTYPLKDIASIMSPRLSTEKTYPDLSSKGMIEKKELSFREPNIMTTPADEMNTRNLVLNYLDKVILVIKDTGSTLKEKRDLYHQAESRGDSLRMQLLAIQMRDIIKGSQRDFSAIPTITVCKNLYSLTMEWLELQKYLLNEIANQDASKVNQITEQLLEVTQKHSKELNHLVRKFDYSTQDKKADSL
ncbi:MAG: hypothetical protein ABIG56_05870 [Candidatus Omnitrophota bacterium]